MTFFKRVFSSDYRRALTAEAAGDYAAAAKAYALAGERAKVAEMHLYLAERAGTSEARLEELRAGVRWADEDLAEGQAIRRRIARALLDQVRRTGVLSESDRALLREAAALFESAGDPAGAGECQELAGDDLAAAESYQRAGELERLEVVLGREEERRRREDRHREAFAEYQLHMASGARDRARAALETALRLRPDEQYRSLLGALEARLIVDGRVTLRLGGEGVRLVGAFPVVLGREPGCHLVLRDPGVSRRHAEVVLEGGELRVRDAGSRNGTFLGGVRMLPGSELPLEGETVLRLGEFCELRAQVTVGRLELEVIRGLDRGLRLVAGSGALPLAGGAGELRFVDGRPLLTAAPGRPLRLGGVSVGGAVQLLRGDRVEVGETGHMLVIEVE